MPPSDLPREPGSEQRDGAGRRLRDAVWRGDLAAHWGHEEIAELLLEHGAPSRTPGDP